MVSVRVSFALTVNRYGKVKGPLACLSSAFWSIFCACNHDGNNRGNMFLKHHNSPFSAITHITLKALLHRQTLQCNLKHSTVTTLQAATHRRGGGIKRTDKE